MEENHLDHDVERLWLTYLLSPKKSINQHNLELDISKSNIYNVLHERLKNELAYKIQLGN